MRFGATAAWLDRVTGSVAPRFTLKRQRARLALELLERHYEAAGGGRRTQGWARQSGDANSVIGPALGPLRQHARDLVRNNPYAESALTTICDHAVGWGITAKPTKTSSTPDARATAKRVFDSWAGTKACDADGQNDLVGLEKLVTRTVVEAGECLVRGRVRRLSDGLPIPLQLQVLEPDFLDTAKDGLKLENGGRVVQGVEFDAIGRRIAYWLFPEHPGSNIIGARNFGSSQRIHAERIVHVFKQSRAGQVRAPSWFGPVILRMKNFDIYDDATLLKQQIAACLAVAVTDVDGQGTGLGAVDPAKPLVDMIEPGMIFQTPPGRSIQVIEPPSVTEYDAFAKTQLRAIATGLGVTYEDLTGDYSDMPYSAARMSRLRHWARVEDWRWRMLVPQLLDPVWGWAMEAAFLAGLVPDMPSVTWTAPPAPMVDPDKEGQANTRNVRGGFTSQSEVIRERGYDPEELFQEIADDNKALDRLGLVLDSDPRRTTQAGVPREIPIAELAERVDALGALIRAGFEPEAAAAAVGLPAMAHLGLPPVTVQAADGKTPAAGGGGGGDDAADRAAALAGGNGKAR